jgi:hypothetical protein
MRPMSSQRWFLTVIMAGGCLAEGQGLIEGVSGDAGVTPDGPAAGLSVDVLEPAAGASVLRGYLAGDGTWIARVEFRAAAPGAAFVDWMSGGAVQGSGEAPDFAFRAEYATDGARIVEAVARGSGGEELGRGTVSFTVSGSPEGGCTDWLRALGVTFVEGPSAMGVPAPVTVTMPLNGVRYHSSSLANAPRTTWFMDCELALAMWKMGDLFQKSGITDAWDYGIYNYRCIDQSVDPPCPGSNLSMHAHAQAVDIAGVKTADGVVYSVNDDWVIDVLSAGKNACTVTPDPAPANEVLHTLVCDLHAKHAYNIILTPNYNAAHRNHVHLDLTDDADVIHKVESHGVDVGSDDQ